jgi:hypothetical protein
MSFKKTDTTVGVLKVLRAIITPELLPLTYIKAATAGETVALSKDTAGSAEALLPELPLTGNSGVVWHVCMCGYMYVCVNTCI